MKKGAFFTLSVIGLALIAVGLFYIKSATEAQGVMKVLPYYCIGIGCGAFGHGTGKLIALKTAGSIQKQIEIEQKDERNVAICNCAKGKAFDAMIYIFSVLIVSFELMSLDLYVILPLVFAYLLVAGISIYYRCKYDKLM